MYNNRNLTKKIKEYIKYFKVILIVGARQVGKSTLINTEFPEYKSFVFDPVQDKYGVRKDPDKFLDNFETPMILDEVQYVPELIPSLKRKVDMISQNGQYILTGSQNILILKDVAESMAGRVGIIKMDGMTLYEEHDLAKHLNNNNIFLHNYLNDQNKAVESYLDLPEIKANLYQKLWRGNLPGILNMPDEIVYGYFDSYVQTYIERDIRRIDNIKDLTLFNRYLGLIAALTAQEINYEQLGRELGINGTVAKNWLNLLIHTYQVREVLPYSGNTLKRLSKKSKICITDSGLACYMQRISTPDALAQNPSIGFLFESWVIDNIIKQCNIIGINPYFYHWRTNGGAEVDLILEMNGNLYPVEIKCKSNISRNDTRGIRAFRETYKNSNVMNGLLVYTGKECYKIDDNVIAVPWIF